MIKDDIYSQAGPPEKPSLLLAYLASPFSHPDTKVEESRYQLVSQVAANLVDRGHVLFCPITHARPMAPYRTLKPRVDGSGFNSWEHMDLEFIRRCDELWVVCLDGWENSVGVRTEVEFARRCHKPVLYLRAQDLEQNLYTLSDVP
jgi:hypothetical protein